jgi:gluconolactonase
MTQQLYSAIGLVLLLVAGAVGADDDSASVVAPGEKVQKLADGMKFTEGPVWLPAEKKLIFSDIPNSRLMQWRESDGLSVFRPSEQANGNILDLQGRLISCQHAARNLVRTEPDGRITVLADRFDGKRFNSPNDVAVRSDGTLWFTDPPWGLTGPHEIPGHWVFKLDPETGKVEAVIKALAMPNGINFSPDERRLYVADTGGHPRHPDPTFHKMPAGIHCYEMSPDGELGKKLFSIRKAATGWRSTSGPTCTRRTAPRSRSTTPTENCWNRSKCRRTRPMSASAATISKRCSSRPAPRCTASG